MLSAETAPLPPPGSASAPRLSATSIPRVSPVARSVETLDLHPALRSKLATAGYRTVEDLEHVTPARLAQELEIPMDEALSVVRQYNQDPIPTTSALDLLERDLRRRPITTFCSALDSLLDSKAAGVPVGVVTEFCGEPGVGKTQIAMQLCVNVQIPKSIGGAGGEALYVDSEGSFIVDRLVQIAQGTIDAINPRLVGQGKGDDMMEMEKMLDKVHYFRVHDYVEQVAVTHLLAETLEQHPNIKLIVIDSIAFHFRQHFSDMALRTRLLLNISNTLMALAKKHELAIVFINQMTTKLGGGSGQGDQIGTMFPALGETWGHCSTHRVTLSFDNATRARKATLIKSPNMQSRTVWYDIVTEGVRDVRDLQEAHRESEYGDETSESMRKRQRNE